MKQDTECTQIVDEQLSFEFFKLPPELQSEVINQMDLISRSNFTTAYNRSDAIADLHFKCLAQIKDNDSAESLDYFFDGIVFWYFWGIDGGRLAQIMPLSDRKLMRIISNKIIKFWSIKVTCDKDWSLISIRYGTDLSRWLIKNE